MTENISVEVANARKTSCSSDGKFGTHLVAEADIDLTTIAGDKLTPLDNEPGDEDFGFPNVVDGTAMDTVSVYRDANGAYTATGYQGFRYSEWSPGDPEDE